MAVSFFPAYGGGGIQSVTGSSVDNTDPDNPIILAPTTAATASAIAAAIAVLTATNTTTVAGSDVQNLSVNLPGVGPVWDFWGCIVFASGGALLSIEPNSLATNLTVEGFVGEGSGTAGKFKDTSIIFAAGDGGGDSLLGFWGTIRYSAGLSTSLTVDSINKRSGDPIRQTDNAYWNVTTVPTSVRVHSDTAGAIKVLSVISAQARI